MNTKIDYSVFNEFPILETERLLLRSFSVNDAKYLFQIRGDERTMRYMDAPLHQSVAQSRTMIEEIEAQFSEELSINWAITTKENKQVIGYICFWKIMPEHVRAELGYALNRQFWGKGFMKEAAMDVLKFGFDMLKLHSVEANVNPNNKASIKMLNGLCFQREAYLKENYFVNDNFVDTYIYSLLEQNFDL